MSNEIFDDELEIEHILFPVEINNIVICIFDNPNGDISFLSKLPDDSRQVGGVVRAINSRKQTAYQRLCKTRRALNVIYHTSKGKILSRDNIKLGFEGRILNDPTFS